MKAYLFLCHVRGRIKSARARFSLIDLFLAAPAIAAISGMKKQYYGKDALLVRSGEYIYNVSSSPSIYYKWAK